MTSILNFAKKLWTNDEGATAIEYGLLAALIAVVIIVAVSNLGQTLQGTFSTVNAEINNPGSTAAPAP